MEAIIESAGWTDGTRCLQEREKRISSEHMLIRPPHGNHGGQNMASGSASAYTTLGSSPMSCSSTAASHTEQSSLRHPPSSGPCHASQSERRR